LGTPRSTARFLSFPPPKPAQQLLNEGRAKACTGRADIRKINQVLAVKIGGHDNSSGFSHSECGGNVITTIAEEN
jgi:hypothetical protein